MDVEFTPEGAPDDERRSALTELAFKALDTLGEEEPEAKLGDAILLFEVLVPDEDGDTVTTVWQKCTSDRTIVAAGLCALGTALNTDGERSD